MPYQNQTEKNVGYIDIRFHFNRETELWTDEDGNVLESYDNLTLNKVERKKLKNITSDEADSLGESFAQMDSYQEFFVTDVPYVISDGNTAKFGS